MKDLTTLTPEQANKLECYLVMIEDDLKKTIEAHDTLSKDKSFLPNLRETFASNAQWYRELYHLIYQKEYITDEKA